MPGLFSRVKTFVFEEIAKSAEINAEFDNIIANLIPAKLDDYSTNITQMQIQTDPGNQGSESLATSMGGEVERLRYMIAAMLGQTYWYDPVPVSLLEANSLINSIAGLPGNRIVSGQTRSATDDFPAFLDPDGTTNTVTIDATPTPMVVRIDGTQYQLNADIVISGLVTAPTINNTALINAPRFADQDWTKVQGEFGTTLPIDAAGTEIVSLVGKIAAFKLTNTATDDEYFIGFVKSATEIVACHRGYFFDSALLPWPRIVCSDNDTITLMKLTWIYLKSDLTAEAVYTNPTYSYDQPSSPSVGDYWFDQGNKTWKRFSGTAWVAADAHLIGICIQDTTATVGARSFLPYANYTNQNTIPIDYKTVTSAGTKTQGGTVSVAGNVIQFTKDDLEWSILTDLESGYAESADTMYFMYITEDGDKRLSPEWPYCEAELAKTFVHPYHLWRCVGLMYNDGASDIVSAGSSEMKDVELIISPSTGDVLFFGAVNTYVFGYAYTQPISGSKIIHRQDANTGSVITSYLPCKVQIRHARRQVSVNDNTAMMVNGTKTVAGATAALAANDWKTFAFNTVTVAALYTSNSSTAHLLPGDELVFLADNNTAANWYTANFNEASMTGASFMEI